MSRRGRDAVTGQFVTLAEAARRPAETIVERRRAPMPVARKPKKGAASPSPKKEADPLRIVRGLDRAFTTAPPPGAETGLFAASPADGYAKHRYRVPDGTYAMKGGEWAFQIAGERLVQAVHRSRPAFWPRKLITVDAA